jgi:alkaline phosphatase D
MGVENGYGREISRRKFLALSGMGAAALSAGVYGASEKAWARPVFKEDPFKLGVASGDPLPTGVVLWTRLAPEPLAEDGRGGMPDRRVPVRYEVAEDEGFRRVVRRGTELAAPEFAHSVHAEVNGLRPGCEYFYRFKVGPETSPVGRTKTAPAPGTGGSLRLAFASCQDWQNGYYAAYGAMAREDVDLVVHLGDYIYEYGPQPGGPRQHTDGETITLSDYRNRHALYKTDEQLQEMHAVAPWMVTWDDHEVENNYADEIPEEGSETPNTEAFLKRRAAAYRAYYEHMPLGRSSLPQGPNMRLYRRFSWGSVAEISLLDTRQYRTDQPCGDGLKERCASALSPSQTMTGPEQERWLLDGLGRSRARWNVIAQQTILAEYDFNAAPGEGPGKELFNMDQWDGYVAARNRILSYLDKRRPANPVVITGDIHSSWVFDLKPDFDEGENGRTIGTEFAGTSITSSFPTPLVAPVQAALPDNPHTKFFDGANRGYVVCDLNAERWETTFRGVPTTPGNGSVFVKESPAFTVARFVVEDGQPGAQPA